MTRRLIPSDYSAQEPTVETFITNGCRPNRRDLPRLGRDAGIPVGGVTVLWRPVMDRSLPVVGDVEPPSLIVRLV